MATTNVDTALPDIEVAPQSQVIVDTGDASAVISLLNVYTVSPVSEARAEDVEPDPFVPLFTYGPATP